MKSFRNRFLIVIDAVLLTALPTVMYALRFESFNLQPDDARTAAVFTLVMVPVELGILLLFGLYRRLWRYASVWELELIFAAGVVAAAAAWAIGAVLLPWSGITPVRVPLSVLAMYSAFSIAVVATPRLLLRVTGRRFPARRASDSDRRVIIAGAGAAGEMVVKEIQSNPQLGLTAVGFVDDDHSKVGLRLVNLPILGTLENIRELAERERVAELIIAMPRASGTVVRDVVRAAYEAGLRTRTVPGLFEILSGRVSVGALREVRIEDLLRRDPVQTDLEAVRRLAEGKTVLVTGAGGSIGSELCRQLVALKPKELVLLGHGENPIFEILHELVADPPAVALTPVIADVRDRHRVKRVLEAHRPYAVFHAAAHKHVPLMEENVSEAITNNVMGTRNLVDAAISCGVQHFVLISTDKAVRPTNVMGATKRIAEAVVQNAAHAHNRHFVSVRFGNVLGSNGSVVPTFLRQIQHGGPVTVTHPEMRRYFMTIPEAVQLVLQAGAQGMGGELFMLDMGEPVKIVDLARDMIRLSGLEEGSDIEIKFSGIRPGEKLYEEMFFNDEIAEPTEHPKVLRARNGKRDHCSDLEIAALIDSALGETSEEQLRQTLKALVPDYVNGNGTPQNGLPSLTDPPTPTRRSQPSGERRRVSAPPVLHAAPRQEDSI
ncbi:MAG TPA: nucleoside-diphosphate sugar epimerase/dehydratase [Gemmatimonadaceae bacterium]|nr:nucleoside-diphosphate sugar epimerase/dehydratase [Gemmatimonadaceae bacterium]